jgi:hypothetical protein
VLFYRLMATGIAVAMLGGCASGSRALVREEPRNAVPGFVLAGVWEGSLVATTTDAPVSFPVNLRLTIQDREARVYTRDSPDSPWEEQGLPGGFVFDVNGTNAVIYANRAGRIPTPEGSRWFETYLVAATVKSPDQLLVHWLRMVTNLDTAVDDPDRAGTSAGDGVLMRK